MLSLTGSAHYNPIIQIGRGDQSIIELDPHSNLVRKTFCLSDPCLVAKQVTREYEYLRRYANALAEQPYVRCPDPVSADPAKGTIWMTFCSGRRLDQALADRNQAIDSHLEHIAEQIALALSVYIRAFDEPYFDFTTANMLYDPDTRVLSLIDLADPQIYAGYVFQDASYDLSVGNFISSTTYHTLRPRVMGNLDYWRRQKRLTLSVMRIVNSKLRLRKDVIRQVQAIKYSAHANYGGTIRRSWFLSVGKLLYWWRLSSIINMLKD
jgi:hypothetical protein